MPAFTETLELLSDSDPEKLEWIKKRRNRLQRKRGADSQDGETTPPKQHKSNSRGKVLQNPIKEGEPTYYDASPSLHQLYCEETLPTRSPSPVPLPDPIKVVQWGDPRTQWLEGNIGKWRVAYSYFMSWYNDNIETIELVEKCEKTNYNTFHELYLPIKQHHADAMLQQKLIEKHIEQKDFGYDLHLDLALSHGIEVALSTGHWGIWQCIDRLAAYCNIILHSIGSETSQQP